MPSRQSPRWNHTLYGAFAFFLAFSAFSVSHAEHINITIDSKFGDCKSGLAPTYLVANDTAWNDETCAGCFIQPNPLHAFDDTWMSATYHPSNKNVSITLEFTGVAVWVFFILSNANIHGPDTTTNTRCNFTIDGQYTGSFSHDPDMTVTEMVYNALVFSKTGLANVSHQLIISVNDYPMSTYLNFDYAIYAMEVDFSPNNIASLSSPTDGPCVRAPPNTTPQLLVGIIVGSILGAVALTTTVLLLMRFLLK